MRRLTRPMERFARAAVAAALLWCGTVPVSAEESSGATPIAPTASAPVSPAPLQRDPAAEVVFRALSLLGVNYRWGGNTVETGLDCSGLVRLVFHDALGLPLPRRSDEISRVGGDVSPTELQPGDLVFFNTLRRAFSHVGIYIGNNQFVHAPSSGGAVRVENLGASYWSTRFDGARRLLDTEAALAADALAPRLADAPPFEAAGVPLAPGRTTGSPQQTASLGGNTSTARSSTVRASERRVQPSPQRRVASAKPARVAVRSERVPAATTRSAGGARLPAPGRRMTVAASARDTRTAARGPGSIYLN